MRIEPGTNSVRPPHSNEIAKPAANPNGSVAIGGSPLTSVDTQSINGVLKLMTGASEIRESVVNDIKLKIQSGEYLAKQDAFETASSILNL